ncbi:MAG: glycoside hydrolase family 97 catalytic domain-containing protein [Prevotellaceae bacterium]|nr:glycoside hydrolase family 97 catalytic domain-containing protein [Prevotellaceae bacterium]
MKKLLITSVLMVASVFAANAENLKVTSPDGRLIVNLNDKGGIVTYDVTYDGQEAVKPSRLGLITNVGDFSRGLSFKTSTTRQVSDSYSIRNIKARNVEYRANELNATYTDKQNREITVTFRVSDNNIAFRYSMPQWGETASIIIKEEATSFAFPDGTTSFICPQSSPMVGWMRTKPSYEEEYKPDAPLTDKSAYGEGYTFPCLFKVGNEKLEAGNYWVLISETGVDGKYVGSHLSDYSADNGYRIAFPMPGEANGHGTTDAALALPGATPWRTITVGSDLRPIVETTISTDVVEQKYAPSIDYRPGRYTWSWLIWQDTSINYADQVKFIDLASAMGYEYVLVDNWWDTQIGRDKIVELSKYAQGKGVSLMLWYNSNGAWSDAPQTPKQCMNTTLARRKEMAWLKSIGVKGIKVDFFAGDKQHTMQLYEDILTDANDFGIQVIFHGCTLPRGWERMYPNYVASEAVLASENTFFNEHHAIQEGFELTMHPFCRNAVASMDWGGTIMNRYMSPDNKSRHRRYTSDIFEMAAAIVIQTSVQCIAIQPNNLTDLPQMELDFLREVPTSWDETRFIDGYPGKYIVMARRSGDRWYVVGLNATKEPLKLDINIPMFADTTAAYYYDKPSKKSLWPESILGKIKVDAKGKTKITIQPNGGIIIK